MRTRRMSTQPHLCNLAGRAVAVVVPVHSSNLALAINIASNALHASHGTLAGFPFQTCGRHGCGLDCTAQAVMGQGIAPHP